MTTRLAFIKRKIAWLDQVLADASISAPLFSLAYVLAFRFLNRTTEEAWPSQPMLRVEEATF